MSNNRCESLIKWIQTFQVRSPHETVEELSDGVAIAQVLGEIAPDWFDSSWLAKIKPDVINNWRLKVSNLKKIMKSIIEHYQEVLNQNISDFKLPDVNAIAEHNDPVDLSRLLQLVLGCAVNCDHKQEYIEIIMGMEESDQHEVMNAIQELMTDLANPGEHFPEVGDQLKRLTDELQIANEAKEHITQQCHELDLQVAMLQEDKMTLQAENERLHKKLSDFESFDDISSAAGKKHAQLQNQLERLQDELYKSETARDELRLRIEELEKTILEIQQKNENLQKISEEARLMKDEIDVLREKAEKAAKYESTIETYKKKLEDLSDLRRQLKILEDKNLHYMQVNIELEEELKRGGSLKTHIDIYKKQVQELHNKLSEETKKADKANFENKKLNDKLEAIQLEKERLVVERDTLKETNEELRLTQLQIENANMSPTKTGQPSSVSSDSDMLEMIPPEIKEKLIRLQHENKILKLHRQGTDDDQLQVLQSMLDDARQHESELQTENRLINQRLIELESQMEDLQNSQSSTRMDDGMKEKLGVVVNQLKESENKIHRLTNSKTDLEAQLQDKDKTLQNLQDVLNRKEDEMKQMEERYKKYLEKAKSVIRTLDPKHNAGASPEVIILRNQLQEKDRVIETLEKESERSQAVREMEERLITSAFYSLGKQLHRKAAEERLATHTAGQTFLARQRQATSRKFGMGLTQRLWNRATH